MCQKNQQIKSGINSKNVNQISYLYKTMGRLHIYYILKCIQFTNELNISNIKYNLSLHKYNYITYLDLYKCQWITLAQLEIAVKDYFPNLEKIDFVGSLPENQLYTNGPSLTKNGTKYTLQDSENFNKILNDLYFSINNKIRIICNCDSDSDSDWIYSKNDYKINYKTILKDYIQLFIEKTTSLFDTCFIGKYLNPYNVKIKDLYYNPRYYIYPIEHLFLYKQIHQIDNERSKIDSFIYHNFLKKMYITFNIIKILYHNKSFQCIKICIINGYKLSSLEYNFKNLVVSTINETQYDNLINRKVLDHLLDSQTHPFCKYSILQNLFKNKYPIDYIQKFYTDGAYISDRFIKLIILDTNIDMFNWCNNVTKNNFTKKYFKIFVKKLLDK